MSLYNNSLPATTTMTTAAGTNEIKMDEAQGTAVLAINVCFGFIGTFGNFLIILAVLKTPQLRERPSNRLLLSLAIADLIVTMVVQPLCTAATALKTFQERCDLTLEMVYMTAAPFSCKSSVLHLTAISIDRVISAAKPHRHREIMKKWANIMLAICWGTAIIFGLFVKFPEVNIASMAIIMLCALVMISSYGVILYKVKYSPKVNVTAASTQNNSACERAMENRVSGTVALITVLFAAFWIPLVGYSFAHPEETFICPSDVRAIWILTSLFANSSINFIVYSFKIRQFRAAYLKIIARMIQPFMHAVGKCIRTTPVPQNISVTQASAVPVSSKL